MFPLVIFIFALTVNSIFQASALAKEASDLLLMLPTILSGNLSQPVPPPPATGNGRITYTFSIERDVHTAVFRIAAENGAQPENISAALDKLSPVNTPLDMMLNSSPNGEWLVLSTNRFYAECADWNCLALVKGDLTSGNALMAGGSLIHPDNWSAVSSAGDLVIFPQSGGSHDIDLWATSKNTQGIWCAPIQLTQDSPYAYNRQPSLSATGSKVVFRCGSTPYDDGSICEVNTNGTGFNVKATAAQASSNFLNQPDYAPDDSIVFEEAGNSEQMWRVPPDSSTPVKITNTFTNDNSPCVLPNGKIASLWIRNSIHELKVMDADGNNHFMVLPHVDVYDVGLGCGQ
jgi:Tol biopolymer transport system component